jgi:hypothetical protein
MFLHSFGKYTSIFQPIKYGEWNHFFLKFALSQNLLSIVVTVSGSTTVTLNIKDRSLQAQTLNFAGDGFIKLHIGKIQRRYIYQQIEKQINSRQFPSAERK